jgi:uncharacterized protein (TIRG00374 family)
MKFKHAIQLFIGIATSAVALWFVFHGMNFTEFIDAFREFDWRWLVPSLGVFYFGIWLRGVRWAWLFRPGTKVSLMDGTAGTFICFALNSVFPARAGEFARCYFIGKKVGCGFSTAVGTVVVERLLDSVILLGGLMLALSITPIPTGAEMSIAVLGKKYMLTGAMFKAVTDKVIWGSALLLLGIVGLSFQRTRGWMLYAMHRLTFIPAFFREKVETIIQKFANGLAAFHNPLHILGFLSITLAIWLTTAGGVMLLAWGFQFQNTMTFVQAYSLVVIICIFILLPAAPGYWGFYEAGTIFAIVMMGVHTNAPVVRSYAILLHLTQYIPIVAVGLPWAWFSHVSLEKTSDPNETSQTGISK